jgi:hypothetical protein
MRKLTPNLKGSFERSAPRSQSTTRTLSRGASKLLLVERARWTVGRLSLVVGLFTDYFRLAQESIPRLAALYPDFTGSELEVEASYGPEPAEDEKQMGLALADGILARKAVVSAKSANVRDRSR